MRSSTLLSVAVLMAASTAHAGPWTTTAGSVQYRVVHKLHEVVGTSSTVEAVAVVDGVGLRVMARAPVASFDSHNQNRDSHMLEVVEGARFPFVVLKAAAPGFVLPATGKAKVRLEGQLELHGVKAPVVVDAELEVVSPTRVVVHLALATKLSAHQIERPALLFIPVEDELAVTGTLTLEPRPEAR
jgi:polyisoprenoid-binding protein YceI